MIAQIKGSKLVEIPFLDGELSEDSKNTLIIGERVGNEGIIETVVRKQSPIVCTDIMEMQENSILDNIIKNNKNVSFIQGDFLNFSETVKYHYICCINVLEHFGMNFHDKKMFSSKNDDYDDDVIKWNYDIKALLKMINLLSNHSTAKIIITVPCGPPIFTGDTSTETTLPFLRRYDSLRIEKIKTLTSGMGLKLMEKYYISEDFSNWFQCGSEVSRPTYFQRQNPFSPNSIWAFTLTWS